MGAESTIPCSQSISVWQGVSGQRAEGGGRNIRRNSQTGVPCRVSRVLVDMGVLVVLK